MYDYYHVLNSNFSDIDLLYNIIINEEHVLNSNCYNYHIIYLKSYIMVNIGQNKFTLYSCNNIIIL